MSNPAELSLLPLEDELRADTNGQHKQQLQQTFAQQAQQIKRLMDKGVTPQEFARLEQLQAALQAGDSALDKIWTRFHPSH